MGKWYKTGSASPSLGEALGKEQGLFSSLWHLRALAGQGPLVFREFWA